jgi:cell division protein FtsB
MTSPSSRRPRRTSRPERAGVPRGRRSTRSGPPTTGPGRRTRTTTATAGAEPATARSLAGSRLTRQIAVLGMVLAVVALSLAYPLRSYLAQRADLAAAVERQHELDQRITELQIQQAALADPNYIAAEAKRRLQYVRPGDTVYVVQAPDLAPADMADTAPTASGGPWYATLWDTLSHPPGTAVDPGVLTPAAAGPTG